MLIKLLPIISVVIGFLLLMIPTVIYSAKLGQKINDWIGECEE